jgi:predicted nucleic acid-binding protein
MPGTCSVDTSPLLYLYRIGQLTLLRRHYDRVLVPEAVVTELDNGRVEGVDVPDVSDFPWIEIRQIELRSVSATVDSFGIGEREVILLALDGHADWVVLDDLAARRQAEKCGVQVIGTVGLLAAAKKKNMIVSVGPFLNALENAGMWLSEDLKRTVLESADEL